LLQRRRIQQVFDDRRYDVIHFHNVSLFGPRILSIAPRLGSPVKIYTAHEHWLVCPTHVLWKFGQRPCEAPECLRCTIRAKRPPQWWRYTGLLSRCAADVDLFLSPSRFTAQLHAERGFARSFEVLPLFVDIDDSEDTTAKRPHPAPYFVYVGRLEPYKGVDRLIRAVLARPEVDLLIVGAGSEEARLRAMANRHPRIQFVGAQPPELVGGYLRHAIACCIPSLTYEVFGNVAIESLGRGTPVIAHDLGGLTEIIGESGGGILYRSDQELIDALRLLASDRRLRDAMGERGRDAYCKRWSREVHLRDYLALIEQVRTRKGK
jgi:glycosyltransferase involved in cell wall biosynthesis